MGALYWELSWLIISDLYNGIYTRSGLFVMLAILEGLVGFLDDWIKIRNARNLGLNKKMKIIGLSTVAFGFAILMVLFTDVQKCLSRANSFFDLGPIGWVFGQHSS